MYRIFSLAILMTFSCSQQESDATIATILGMTNALEVNNKHLVRENTIRVEMIREQVEKKTNYKALAVYADEVMEITQELTDYINHVDHQLFRAPDYEVSYSNLNVLVGELNTFNFLPLEVLKNKEIARDFFNEAVEGSTRSSRQALIDSTLATQDKLTALLTSVKKVRLFEITPQEVDSLIQNSLSFANGSIQPNGKTRLQNAFEGKSIAGSHAALVLLKNEVLTGAGQFIHFLYSKIGSRNIGMQPVIVSYPVKNRFKRGSTFETDIFIFTAAWYQEADIKMEVNGDSIAVKNGIGFYKRRMPQSGKFTYKAKVSILNPFTNKRDTYVQTFYYE